MDNIHSQSVSNQAAISRVSIGKMEDILRVPGKYMLFYCLFCFNAHAMLIIIFN